MTSGRQVLIDEVTGSTALARVVEERIPVLLDGPTRTAVLTGCSRAAVSASGGIAYSRERLRDALGPQRAGDMPAQLMPEQHKTLLFVFDDLWEQRSRADRRTIPVCEVIR